MAKNPTLKDVANRAGVSTATVARVIHDNGYVAVATRERVEYAIEETGYQMNVLAQSLRRQRTRVLGNLLFGMHPNPFYARIALGTEQFAQQHGYSILDFSVQGDVERERIGVETLIRRQVDAILFITPASAVNVQLAVDAGVPVVQVERNYPRADQHGAGRQLRRFGGCDGASDCARPSRHRLYWLCHQG